MCKGWTRLDRALVRRFVVDRLPLRNPIHEDTSVALLTTMALLLVGTVALGAPAQAMAKIKCKMTTGAGAVDPIVHHNEPVGGAMGSMIHKHQFFGNNAPGCPTQLGQLRRPRGQGHQLRNTADTAGYWTPQLQ